MSDRRGKNRGEPNNRPPEDDGDVSVETLAQTENYIAWLSHEPDGETVYHLELGAVTLHFFREEFEEVLELVLASSEAHS